MYVSIYYIHARICHLMAGYLPILWREWTLHYIDVIMTTMASQITCLTVVYLTVYSDADQRKHQSSASLAFVQGIHQDRWIPRTKGQLRGKCLRLMTSSWALGCMPSHQLGPVWVMHNILQRIGFVPPRQNQRLFKTFINRHLSLKHDTLKAVRFCREGGGGLQVTREIWGIW